MSNLKIGFTNSPFPLKEGSDQNIKDYLIECLGHKVIAKAREVKYTMDMPDKAIEFKGIMVDGVSVSEKLYAGGFGSYCHIDEANTMVEAANIYCKEKGLIIDRVLNNWPNFRALVSKSKVKNKLLKK